MLSEKTLASSFNFAAFFTVVLEEEQALSSMKSSIFRSGLYFIDDWGLGI